MSENDFVTSFVLINVNLGKEEELLEQFKTIEEVKEAYIVMGSYDIILKVEIGDAKQLRPLVTNKIRSLEGVRETMTVIAV